MTTPDRPNAEEVARGLRTVIRRAVLQAPFNSASARIDGRHLMPFSLSNPYCGKASLFVRKGARDYSGNYSLTQLGLEVRAILEREQQG